VRGIRELRESYALMNLATAKVEECNTLDLFRLALGSAKSVCLDCRDASL